jgi:hypothetical protein
MNSAHPGCTHQKSRHRGLRQDTGFQCLRRQVFRSAELDHSRESAKLPTGVNKIMTRFGRSWQHWADEGCVLANEVEGLNCYRERTMQMWLQYGKLPDRAPGQGRRKTEQTPLFDEDVG